MFRSAAIFYHFIKISIGRSKIYIMKDLTRQHERVSFFSVCKIIDVLMK